MHNYLIYLASGNGSRFGRNKLLTNVNGLPLFQFGLNALQQAADRIPECTVIAVSRYPEIQEYARRQGILAADCPDSVLGVSHTIKAGIRAISHLRQEDYLLFSVADQPGIQVDSLVSLLRKADGKTETARLSFGGTPGNPVLFSASLVPELLSLRGDQGGGLVAGKHDCILVEASCQHELQDLDTPEDLKKI